MKKIANTKHGSKHNQALRFLKDYKRDWYSPRSVENYSQIGMYPNLARRFREDVNMGILKVRHTNGYAEYQFKSGRVK